MNWCKLVAILIIIILGLIFLFYFILTIKTLSPVQNIKLTDINGSIYLEWDPIIISGITITYIIGLNVGGFLSKRSTIRNRIPLYQCNQPIKSTDHNIQIDYVIIARGGTFNPSPAVSGTLRT